MSYRNPIIPGFNPDPSITRVGEDFYIAVSSFEYFPGVPIYHSRDLIHWELIVHALTRKSQLDMRNIAAGGGIFAPTIRHWKGKIYVACCVMYRSNGAEDQALGTPPRGFYVAVDADKIRDGDAWSDPVYVDLPGIDQDLFFDDDDRVYLSVATTINDPAALKAKSGWPLGVHVCEIALKTGNSLTPDQLICYTSVGNGIAEGSHIFKRDGMYYLIAAIGGTEVEHQEWIYRSTNGPFGPWEAAPASINPMIYNGTHPEIQQTGHMDVIEDAKGKWWAVFFGVRPQYAKGTEEALLSQLGRESFLCPMEWTEDGWPIVNRRQPVTLNGLATSGLSRLEEKFTVNFEFNPAESLPLGWYHMRTPHKQEYDLHSRPGALALRGGPWDFRSDEAVTMVLQKQTAFDGSWKTKLDFLPGPEEEAGTTVWWSKWCYTSVGIRGREHGREIVFRHPDPDTDDFYEESFAISPKGIVSIEVKAHPIGYMLSYTIGKDTKLLTEVPSRALVRTRPKDSLFTGTFFGLYAMGAKGRPCLKNAYFSDVSWSGVRAGGA